MEVIRKRIYYLDVMRVFACFLVVLTHSQMPNIPENGIYLSSLSLLCSPSSEMFLMLSGAILLPVKTDTSKFYKRRFIKLLPPMVFWSLFGIVLRYIQGTATLEQSIHKTIYLPFKPVEGVYWFLYVMIGLYLFAPIISHWLNKASKKEIELFLIWLINMVLPWLNLIEPNFYNQNGSYYWVFCYYGGFLGYWILGFYLRKYTPGFSSKIGITILLLSIVYPLAIFYLKLQDVDTLAYTDNLQIGSAVWVAFLFMIIKRISDSKYAHFLNLSMSNIAKYSFGIYLLHIYVIRDLVWIIMENYRLYSHPIIEALLIALISMILCVTIIMATSRLYRPIGIWLFGLNHKKQ